MPQRIAKIRHITQSGRIYGQYRQVVPVWSSHKHPLMTKNRRSGLFIAEEVSIVANLTVDRHRRRETRERYDEQDAEIEHVADSGL
jgi:hypothetical protein